MRGSAICLSSPVVPFPFLDPRVVGKQEGTALATGWPLGVFVWPLVPRPSLPRLEGVWFAELVVGHATPQLPGHPHWPRQLHGPPEVLLLLGQAALLFHPL